MDPSLVYGWCQNDRETKIVLEWLNENKINDYITDMVRNCAGYFLYGLPCKIDEATGMPSISEDDKKLVEEAHKKSGSTEKLGYYLGMSGDSYESTCHTEYNPSKPDTEEEKAAKKRKRDDDLQKGRDAKMALASMLLGHRRY